MTEQGISLDQYDPNIHGEIIGMSLKCTSVDDAFDCLEDIAESVGQSRVIGMAKSMLESLRERGVEKIDLDLVPVPSGRLKLVISPDPGFIIREKDIVR